MPKILVWYVLFFKSYLKRKSAWIQIIAMILMTSLMLAVHIPDGNNMYGGIYISESNVAEQVVEHLTENSTFQFIVYDNREELQKDVESGKLECGFVIAQDFDQKIKKGDLEDCVLYICTPMTSKGEVMKESFYEAFFQIYSDTILENNEKLFFGNENDRRLDKWISTNHEYREGSKLFRVEYHEVYSAVSLQAERKIYPVQGVVGLMILLILFLSHGRRFEPNGMAVEKALFGKERFFYSVCGMLAAGTIPALTGIILVLYSGGSRGTLREIFFMILFLIWAAVWTWLIGKLQHSLEGQISLVLIILVINVLICPIFFDLAEYIPAMQYVKYISPLGLYL